MSQVGFGRFSKQLNRVLSLAHDEAQRLKHSYIGTEHLLIALAAEPATPITRLLAVRGVEVRQLRAALEFIAGDADADADANGGSAPGASGLTPRAGTVLRYAVEEADRAGQTDVRPEHLLLAILREGEGIAIGLIESLGASPDRIRASVIESVEHPEVQPRTTRLNWPTVQPGVPPTRTPLSPQADQPEVPPAPASAGGQVAPTEPPPPAPARLSRRARSALLQAQLVARWYFHGQVDTQHLLVGLLRERGSSAAQLLGTFGIELPALLERFEALPPDPAETPSTGGVSYTLAAQAALDQATHAATQRGQALAGTDHLLLGVVSIVGGQAIPLLSQFNITPELVRERVEPLLATDDD